MFLVIKHITNSSSTFLYYKSTFLKAYYTIFTQTQNKMDFQTPLRVSIHKNLQKQEKA